MQQGDTIFVVDENHELHGEVLFIDNPDGNISYREFVGNHIIAKDDKATKHVLRDGQYAPYGTELKESKKLTFDNIVQVSKIQPINLYDVVTPKTRDNGLQKLFYVVVDVTEKGIAIHDDMEHTRWFNFDKVSKVDESRLIHYIHDLQEQIHSLRQLVVQSLELTTDDIQRKLEEFKS